MIIWRGWGLLVIVIAVGCRFLAEVVTEAYFRNERYYETRSWPFLAAMLAAAAIVALLGNYLNRRYAQTTVNRATGESVILRKKHSLLFIPMEFWAIILVILGVVSIYYRPLATFISLPR